MSGGPIVIKIDWCKIDQERLYVGEKTDWLNLVLKDNRDGRDQYGYDGFVTQDLTKEERDLGDKAPIIGNWKRLGHQEPSDRRNESPDDRSPRGARQERRPAPPQRGDQRREPAQRRPDNRPQPGTRSRYAPPTRSQRTDDDNRQDDDAPLGDADKPYDIDAKF